MKKKKKNKRNENLKNFVTRTICRTTHCLEDLRLLKETYDISEKRNTLKPSQLLPTMCFLCSCGKDGVLCEYSELYISYCNENVGRFCSQLGIPVSQPLSFCNFQLLVDTCLKHFFLVDNPLNYNWRPYM
jgi:hypothetical protein